MIRLGPAWPIAALATAACVGAPPVELGAEADARAARRLLAEAAARGPVSLLSNLPPDRGGLPRPALEAAAAEGVPNLSVDFDGSSAAGGGARLLLLFDPPPEPATGVCGAAGLAPPHADGMGAELAAVFCDGTAYVAHAVGRAARRGPEDTRRLVWRTTARLFPDDYADTYGLDLFGFRVGLSGSFGF